MPFLWKDVGWKDAISFTYNIPLTIRQLESEQEVK